MRNINKPFVPSRFGHYLLLIMLAFAASTAWAADAYKRLSQPQPTENPDQIEVVEVFWYGCPHCHDFEPYLNEWLENKPDDVYFKRLPAIFRQDWLVHAKAFYAARELGVLDRIHHAMFEEIHTRQKRLTSEEALKKFFQQQGVDGDAFTRTYNSQTVESHIKKALTMLRRYEVTGVPAVVINGKYLTSAAQASSYDAMIGAINELIEKERGRGEQAAN